MAWRSSKSARPHFVLRPQYVRINREPRLVGTGVALNGIILAGGKSRRLGIDKTVLEIAGKRLLRIVMETVRNVADDLIIVTNAPHLFQGLPARLTGDVEPGAGPLGGILSGLLVSSEPYSLVVGCDMPFLNAELLAYLRGCVEDYDVVMPEAGGNLEPLHAVYSKACIEPIQTLLAQRNFTVIDLMNEVRVRYVSEEEIDRFDPTRLTFFNINTPQDLEKARRELERRGILERP